MGLLVSQCDSVTPSERSPSGRWLNNVLRTQHLRIFWLKLISGQGIMSAFRSSFTIESILSRPTHQRCMPYAIPHPYPIIPLAPGYIGTVVLFLYIVFHLNRYIEFPGWLCTALTAVRHVTLAEFCCRLEHEKTAAVHVVSFVRSLQRIKDFDDLLLSESR